MNRLLATAFIFHTALLTAPTTGHAHGTERHFGTSLDDGPVFKSSPAFLEMMIEISFSRAISHIVAAPEKLDSDLSKLIRHTTELATSQSGSPEFDDFSRLTLEQAEVIRDASRDGSNEPAIDGVKTLQEEFERLRPKIKKKKSAEN